MSRSTPVRGVTNQSSGNMGYAVAQAALEAGAEVTLVPGVTALAASGGRGARGRDHCTARCHKAVMARAKQADVFISVPRSPITIQLDPKPHKIKRGNGNLNLELALNPDILGEVAAFAQRAVLRRFCSETEDLKANAQAKRKKKGIPLLAANLAHETFGKDTNALTLFDDNGLHETRSRGPRSCWRGSW